jgi:hypothetical protein
MEVFGKDKGFVSFLFLILSFLFFLLTTENHFKFKGLFLLQNTEVFLKQSEKKWCSTVVLEF